MPPRLVIVLTGLRGSGKDTVARMILEHESLQGMCARSYSFADPLREIVSTLFGFTTQQLHDRDLKERVDPQVGVSPRTALQRVGTNLFRAHFQAAFEGTPLATSAVWVDALVRRLRAQDGGVAVVVDARFENELFAAASVAPTQLYCIVRDAATQSAVEVEPHVHESEALALAASRMTQAGEHARAELGLALLNNNGSLDDLRETVDRTVVQPAIAVV